MFDHACLNYCSEESLQFLQVLFLSSFICILHYSDSSESFDGSMATNSFLSSSNRQENVSGKLIAVMIDIVQQSTCVSGRSTRMNGFVSNSSPIDEGIDGRLACL